MAGLRNAQLKIWRAGVTAAAGTPGTILQADAGGIVVACGAGALCIRELQRAGGKKLNPAQFLAGFPLACGERLESFPNNTL